MLFCQAGASIQTWRKKIISAEKKNSPYIDYEELYTLYKVNKLCRSQIKVTIVIQNSEYCSVLTQIHLILKRKEKSAEC
jgi:hypothetical protein